MTEDKCEKCNGSGEVAVNSRTCLYVAPGPVPEDAKGVTRSTCFYCLGTGFTPKEPRDETNPFAPLDNDGWMR